MGGMILRSNGGIHRPHNAVALGNAGALIYQIFFYFFFKLNIFYKHTSKAPINNRIAIRKPTCKRAASGVKSVKIPGIKILIPNIHLAPKRSANVPINMKLLL